MLSNRHEEYFRCSCGTHEHMFIINWDDDWDKEDYEWCEVWISYHLQHGSPWHRRVIQAIKHIFGHKSRYGDFGNIGLDRDTIKRLIKTLEKAYGDTWSND